jgi:glucose-1-phosphate adenylyltransferase
MDYRKMINFHLEKGADVTVAAVEMDKTLSRDFGVITIDRNCKILEFHEKPARPKTIPGKSDKILASMGIYVFNTGIMVRKLIEDAKKKTAHDFGKNILPSMVNKDRVFAYNFKDEKGDAKYWMDVGTVEAYFEANMDMISISPLLNLYDPAWPIHTYHGPSPPAKILFGEHTTENQGGGSEGSIISGGCIINGAKVTSSLLSPDVMIENSATIEKSILLDGVRIGAHAKIKKAIIDKGSKIPPGMQIGYDLKEDAKKFTVTESGIVVVPKGFKAA